MSKVLVFVPNTAGTQLKPTVYENNAGKLENPVGDVWITPDQVPSYLAGINDAKDDAGQDAAFNSGHEFASTHLI